MCIRDRVSFDYVFILDSSLAVFENVVVKLLYVLGDLHLLGGILSNLFNDVLLDLFVRE